MNTSEPVREKYQGLLGAASFAARAHRQQLRKDGATPYIAHPFRVCLIVRHVFGIDDPKAPTAALLHDTIEDTATDRDDLIEQFGPEVADWVATLSKDKRLVEEDREDDYMLALTEAPDAVKICKLADIFDNLMDSQSLSKAQRDKAILRSRMYLGCLEKNMTARVRHAFEIVSQLLAEIEQARMA